MLAGHARCELRILRREGSQLRWGGGEQATFECERMKGHRQARAEGSGAGMRSRGECRRSETIIRCGPHCMGEQSRCSERTRNTDGLPTECSLGEGFCRSLRHVPTW